MLRNLIAIAVGLVLGLFGAWLREEYEKTQAIERERRRRVRELGVTLAGWLNAADDDERARRGVC